MAYDYINFSCTLSTAYGTPGLYATLTDCENAVNDGSVKPILILNPLWSASKKASLPLLINKLGDGYQQIVFQGIDLINEEWSITSPVLIGTEVDELLNQLRSLCTISFFWSPNNGVIDYQEFVCDEWQKIRVGANQYQLTTTFRSTFAIPGKNEFYGSGIIRMTCDNAYTLFLNGVEIGSGNFWPVANIFSVNLFYENQIAVVGTDAGFIAGLLSDISVGETTINTDSSWKYSLTEQAGWKDVDFDESSWLNATEVAPHQGGGWPNSIANMSGTTAKWIWSASQLDNIVYFRKKIKFR